MTDLEIRRRRMAAVRAGPEHVVATIADRAVTAAPGEQAEGSTSCRRAWPSNWI